MARSRVALSSERCIFWLAPKNCRGIADRAIFQSRRPTQTEPRDRPTCKGGRAKEIAHIPPCGCGVWRGKGSSELGYRAPGTPSSPTLSTDMRYRWEIATPPDGAKRVCLPPPENEDTDIARTATGVDPPMATSAGAVGHARARCRATNGPSQVSSGVFEIRRRGRAPIFPPCADMITGHTGGIWRAESRWARLARRASRQCALLHGRLWYRAGTGVLDRTGSFRAPFSDPRARPIYVAYRSESGGRLYRPIYRGCGSVGIWKPARPCVAALRHARPNDLPRPVATKYTYRHQIASGGGPIWRKSAAWRCGGGRRAVSTLGVRAALSFGFSPRAPPVAASCSRLLFPEPLCFRDIRFP